MCDRYLAGSTLFLSLSCPHYPHYPNWKNPLRLLEVLQFSTLIPYQFVPWLILYMASYLDQAANALKARTTAAALSFVDNISKCLSTQECTYSCSHSNESHGLLCPKVFRYFHDFSYIRILARGIDCPGIHEPIPLPAPLSHVGSAGTHVQS